VTGFGRGFLRQPDLFPGRRSGEPWGGAGVALELAGDRYAFSGLEGSDVDVLRGRYGQALLAGGGPGIETLVFRADSRDFCDRDRGAPLTFDLDYSEDCVRLAGHAFVARLDWRPSLQGALWTSARGSSFLGVFENYFRVLLANRLLEVGGALVHSAGVRDETGACLFFGQSGAGKSTLSARVRAAGGALVSDDLNAICVSEGEPCLAALPFFGDHAPDPSPRLVPLRAIGRLRKSHDDSLQPIDLPECLASLVACSPFVSRDPYRADRLLQNLESMLQRVPAYELHFSRTGSSFDLFRAGQP
jgi:hypothetical protein